MSSVQEADVNPEETDPKDSVKNAEPKPLALPETGPALSAQDLAESLQAHARKSQKLAITTANTTVALSNILGLFENLASKRNCNPTDNQSATSKLQNEPPQLRRTSDLLDTLQQALMKPPAPPESRPTEPLTTEAADAMPHIDSKTNFPVSILIENAVNVTKMCVRVNKKSTSRNRSKTEHFDCVKEQDASTYVTFEAEGSAVAKVKSPDGMVYTTQVVERTSNPVWNKQFDVWLPIEMLHNIQKRFILKVWRKTDTDGPNTKLLPTPFQDIIVGFVTINISMLMHGADTISECFNVTDLYGRCNGRIKITITPKESVINFPMPDATPQVAKIADGGEDESEATSEYNSLLNQTLKRKFTELEDISKRLKARLVDVTEDADFCDLEDEFETELNTLPEEEEDGEEKFNWEEAGNAAAAASTTTVVKSEKEPEKEPTKGVIETDTTNRDKMTEEQNVAATSSDKSGDGDLPCETVVISKALEEALIEETH